MSQIIAMAKRLQECEDIIETLRKNEASRCGSMGSLNEVTQSETCGPEPNTIAYKSNSSLPHEAEISEKAKTSEDLLTDLSLDENGKVCGRYSAAWISLIRRNRSVTMAQHPRL